MNFRTNVLAFNERNQFARNRPSEYVLLLTISFLTSSLLFFSDKNLHLILDGNTAFSDFSVNIFKKNTSYFAESILVPLLAKLLGASSSLVAYKILCSILTILVLPIVSIAAYQYFRELRLAVSYIFVIAISFPWFRNAGIGQPDPTTILFLLLSAFQRNPKSLFICLFLASLSHFSLALVTTPALLLFIYATSSVRAVDKKKLYKALILGVGCGKFFLSLWYFVFDYSLATRLDWVIDRGPLFFITRYENDPVKFWTTPDVFFLIPFLALSIYFCLLKRVKLSFAMWFALATAYGINFITIDGYRITAVILAAPLAFSIKELFLIHQNRFAAGLRYLEYALDFVLSGIRAYWLDTAIVIGLSFLWAYLLIIAAGKGLLINSNKVLTFNDYPVYLLETFILITAAFLTIVFSIKNIKPPMLGKVARLCIVTPLPLIMLQYFRHIFFFNQPLRYPGVALAIIFLSASLVLLFRMDPLLLRAARRASQILHRIISF